MTFGRNPKNSVLKYPSGAGSGCFFSSIRKNPSIPETSTIQPMMRNRIVQCAALSCSAHIVPPKTTRIATSGIMALMPSALPRFVSSVLSVSQALKQASFAVEPKNVIMQSNTMTSVTPIDAAFAALSAAEGKSFAIQSTRSAAKHRIETPQRI